MSSGSLPLKNYHRAQALGSGSYGSVLTVYNEDGEEFALKLFDDDDDSDDDDYSSEDDDSDEEGYESEATCPYKPLNLGAMREISILRMLRGENAHPNVIAISDVKQTNDVCDDEDDYNNDASMDYLGITMPLFHCGTLTSAIESKSLSKRNKIGIAHGLLSAVAYLHTNGIIHRDIKADNVMIEIDDEGNYKPVLIDFSLSTIIQPRHIYSKASSPEAVKNFSDEALKDVTHTPGVGTPTYRSPECYNEEPYGFPSDLYSIGVILLELVRDQCLETFRDKAAFKLVQEESAKLPDQPFPNLIRKLLEIDPANRPTARDALSNPVFEKFGFQVHHKTFSVIDICEALPLDIDEENMSFISNLKEPNKKLPKTVKNRVDLIKKIGSALECEHPMTFVAALEFSIQLAQLEDCLDDLSESQGLIDCVVLAASFFEYEDFTLSWVESLETGIFKKCNWSAETYLDNEYTIFMLMDFCLYPRTLTIL